MNPIEIKDVVRHDEIVYPPKAVPHCVGGDPHCPRRRRIKWALGLAALGAIAVPGSFFVRANVFPPVFPLPSIAETSEYQVASLLAKAWQLPVAQRFAATFQ